MPILGSIKFPSIGYLDPASIWSMASGLSFSRIKPSMAKCITTWSTSREVNHHMFEASYAEEPIKYVEIKPQDKNNTYKYIKHEHKDISKIYVQENHRKQIRFVTKTNNKQQNKHLSHWSFFFFLFF